MVNIIPDEIDDVTLKYKFNETSQSVVSKGMGNGEFNREVSSGNLVFTTTDVEEILKEFLVFAHSIEDKNEPIEVLKNNLFKVEASITAGDEKFLKTSKKIQFGDNSIRVAFE